MNELNVALLKHKNNVNAAIEHCLQVVVPRGQQAHSYADAIAYPLVVGGKRVRGILVALMAGALGGEKAYLQALKVSAAIELIHAYSLVHDDLPSMDNDDIRRGKPTAHKVFGEAQAILIGDALLTHAFAMIMESDLTTSQKVDITKTLADASGPRGMVLGQWLDISSTGNDETLKWQDIENIHRLKTGKLLAAAFICGMIVGGAQIENSEIFEEFGVIFQIVDDILDVTQSSTHLGKTAKKDLVQNKASAVAMLGLEGAQKLALEKQTQAMQELKELLPSIQSGDSIRADFQEQLFSYLGSLFGRSN